jgi:hypothetical protein
MSVPAEWVPLKECPLPPLLTEAVGYDGSQRFVALYWEPCGDELAWDDGVAMHVGAEYEPWLKFTWHPAVRPHLAGFRFGGSDQRAEHYLVVDRLEQRAYVAAASRAKPVLDAQADDFWKRKAKPVSVTAHPLMKARLQPQPYIGAYLHALAGSVEYVQSYLDGLVRPAANEERA